MKEVWKDIKGYEGLYQVSNLGRVKSLHKGNEGKIMNQTISKEGYLRVHLCKDGKKKTIDVHRLVAIAFIPNPDNLPCVNHKDEVKSNNVVTNIEWCSYSYNNKYGTGNNNRTETKKNTWNIKKYENLIEQYTNKGSFIATYKDIETASKYTNIPIKNIERCINGKIKSICGFVFRKNVPLQCLNS